MAQNIEMQYLNSSGQYVKMVPHTIASDNSCFLSTETAGLFGLGTSATPNDVFSKIFDGVYTALNIPAGTKDPATLLDNLLDEYIATKRDKSVGFVCLGTSAAHPVLAGNSYILKINVISQKYVSVEAVSYNMGTTSGAKIFTRSKYNGVWNEWRNEDHLETGNYTGAGIYGESYKNSLTFGILPRFVLIFGPYSFAFYKWGDTTLQVADPIMGKMTENSVATAGKTMTWYTTTPGEGRGETQLNGNEKYNYVAI